MNLITDFLRNLMKRESLFLFYDMYRVNSQYAPELITNYINLVEADSLDSAIYIFVMNNYIKIDWNLLDHQLVRDSYKHIFTNNELCPSLHDWIHESIEGHTIQTNSLVPFMKQYFINNADQKYCISVQEIEPICNLPPSL
jgi:hypothetical protein